MKRAAALLAIILLPFTLLAMNTLSDSDLSNISNPLSLSINPDQIMGSDNDSKEAVDYSGISKFLLNSIKRGIVFNPDVHEDKNKTQEVQSIGSPLFFVLWDHKKSHFNIQNYLLDPITLKDSTTIISAEDSSYNVYVTPSRNTSSMTYPDGSLNSSSSPSRYMIKSGNIDMRDTYINQTKSNIQPNSWVDIKPR